MPIDDEELCDSYRTALAALERGDVDRARREFELVLMEAPRFAPAWDGLAGCYDAEGDLKRAGDCYRKSMRLDRGGWRSRYNWGAALHRAGEVREACRWFSEAARRAPGERCIHHRLGQCHFDLGEYEEALRCFRRALEQPERDVRDSEIHVSIGHAEVERGDFEAAEKAYELACLLSPDDPTVYYSWALVSARQGDLSGAQRLAVRARALDSRSLRYALLPVRLAMDASEWDSAAARIDEIGALPDCARLAQALRAELARRRGRSDEARALALTALTMDGPPSDQAVDSALGTLREIRGLRVPCRGFRFVVQAEVGEQTYFRPFVVLAEDEPQAGDFVAEIQRALDPNPWWILETEYFDHDGETLAGVHHVLLTRVLFPRETQGIADCDLHTTPIAEYRPRNPD